MESILEACNVPESVLDEGTMALSGFFVFLLLVLSFTPSSSSSSSSCQIWYYRHFSLHVWHSSPRCTWAWQAEACVCMNVCPLEVSPSLFLQLWQVLFIIYLLKTRQRCKARKKVIFFCFCVLLIWTCWVHQVEQKLKCRQFKGFVSTEFHHSIPMWSRITFGRSSVQVRWIRNVMTFNNFLVSIRFFFFLFFFFVNIESNGCDVDMMLITHSSEETQILALHSFSPLARNSFLALYISVNQACSICTLRMCTNISTASIILCSDYMYTSWMSHQEGHSGVATSEPDGSVLQNTAREHCN